MWNLYDDKDFIIPFRYWQCSRCGFILVKENKYEKPPAVCFSCKYDHSKEEKQNEQDGRTDKGNE